jgi:hypothetical protein
MKDKVIKIMLGWVEKNEPIETTADKLLDLFAVSGSVCQCKVNRMIVRHEDKDWCNTCGELVKVN